MSVKLMTKFILDITNINSLHWKVNPGLLHGNETCCQLGWLEFICPLVSADQNFPWGFKHLLQ